MLIPCNIQKRSSCPVTCSPHVHCCKLCKSLFYPVLMALSTAHSCQKPVNRISQCSCIHRCAQAWLQGVHMRASKSGGHRRRLPTALGIVCLLDTIPDYRSARPGSAQCWCSGFFALWRHKLLPQGLMLLLQEHLSSKQQPPGPRLACGSRVHEHHSCLHASTESVDQRLVQTYVLQG